MRSLPNSQTDAIGGHTKAAKVARYLVAGRRPLVPRAIGCVTVEPACTWDAIAQVGGRVIEQHPDFVPGSFDPKPN